MSGATPVCSRKGGCGSAGQWTGLALAAGSLVHGRAEREPDGRYGCPFVPPWRQEGLGDADSKLLKGPSKRFASATRQELPAARDAPRRKFPATECTWPRMSQLDRATVAYVSVLGLAARQRCPKWPSWIASNGCGPHELQDEPPADQDRADGAMRIPCRMSLPLSRRETRSSRPLGGTPVSQSPAHRPPIR